MKLHPNAIDLTNQRFGRLLVTSITNRRNKSRDCIWNCLCDCGKTTEVMSYSLKSGNTQSCGCYHKERIRKPLGYAALHKAFLTYQRGALDRDLEFCLTKEKFTAIVTQNCNYCGMLPQPRQYKNKKSHCNGAFVMNGIDRVDSSIGYIESNCVPCCSICNQMKWVLTKEEFLTHISRIYEFSKR